MSERQDYVALDWIKQDIAETLGNAQQDLQAVAESSADTSRMRSCLTAIHQVHGTLKMVGLEVAIQFAEEMESTAQSLMNDSVTDVLQTQEILMQAILQMPGYLQRVQKDQQESLDYVLPIINGLREARGEERIEADGEPAREVVADIGIFNQKISKITAERFSAKDGQLTVRKLRQRYRRSLKALLSKQDARKNLELLAKVFAMLAKICGKSPSGHLAQLGVALVEAISNGSVKLNAELSLSLRKIDRELKQLADEGVKKLARPVPEELILSILLPLLNDAKETARIVWIKKTYAATDQKQAESAPRAMLGPDDETVSTVVKILIEEIVGAKDKLDLYVRSHVKSKDDLQSLIPVLEQVSNTLAVVGLAEHQETIHSQIEVLTEAVSQDEEPAGDLLLGVASAFLKVEALLSPLVKASDDVIESESMGNLDEAHAAVIQETRNGLAQCKDAVIDFISSEWDHAKIDGLPKLLSDLRGGLSMLAQTRAGDVLLACAGYVEIGLLKKRRVPALDEMEDLADVLTSVDYYLERFIENSKDPYIQMLEVAEASLEKLGYPTGRIAELVDKDQQVADEPIAMEDGEEVDASQAEERVLISPPFERSESVVEDPSDERAEDAIEEVELAAEESQLPTEEVKEAAEESNNLEKAEEIRLSPQLVEIFREEAASHLAILQAFIQDAETAPLAISEQLLASLHTLKGSSAMAAIDSVAQIARPLHDLGNQLYQRNIKVENDLLDLLQRGTALLATALADIDEYVAKLVEGTDQFQQSLADVLSEIMRGNDADNLAVYAEVTPFSFEGINLLLDASEVLPRWQEHDLTLLRAELKQLGETAAQSGRLVLNNLVQGLLQAYYHLDESTPPSEQILAALQAGHEAVIDLLDLMAASQEVSLDESVLEHLTDLIEDYDRKKITETEVADEVDARGQFVLDARDHLNNMAVSIQKWKEDVNNLKELEQLNRHVNLIRSAAEIAGVTEFVTMCNPVIQLCERITTSKLFGTESDVKLFEECRNRFSDLLNEIRDGHKIEPADDFIAQVEGRMRVEQDPQTDKTPSEEPEDDVDEEILSIFIEEADELLESIDLSIHDWNSNRNAPVHLENLLRHLHTIKGGSRMAGLNSLGEYSHKFETFLIDIQRASAPVDDEFFADLNRRQDEVVRRVEIYRRLATGEIAAGDLASLVTYEQAPLAQSADAEPTDASTPRLISEAAPALPMAGAEVAPDEEPAEQSTPQAAAPDPSNTPAPHEMIRVSADLLEDLISLATESSITRDRIEQQISHCVESLDEMDMTVKRVRDQVRRLEIETESRQTILREAQGEEGKAPFDALEMDRYSLLQEISRSLSEGTSDMLDLKDTLLDSSRDVETLLLQQARLGTELQEGLTRTRMVPFSRLLPRLRRITRQVSAELGKKVRFDAYNIEGELDRNVLERIAAPLEHMLRNAVDHGIESADMRKAANKPEVGRISLRLSREGGYLILQISDDGGGIDVKEIRIKAIERGLMSEDSDLSDQEILQFIMKAGFSTAKNVTQISGRGVGMDVVDTELKQLGGTITIDSSVGVGTEFLIRIPFTVSINRALMVVVKDETYAVPLNTIEGIVRVSPYELEAYYQPEAPMFEYAGQPYRLEYMGKILSRSDSPNLAGQISPLPVILARSGDTAVALQVDRVIGSKEVVVKSLGQQLSKIGGVSGATILGDGSVVIILDIMALVRASDAHSLLVEAPQEAEPGENQQVRTVMVVDDSVTVRKVTSRIIERQGWNVMLAKDGVDAVSQLQDRCPDVMLLDIEMPRMDGFEVLRTVRRNERLKRLPIIMITSRTGEKHKLQAKELGVNEYLGKPFQEDVLLSTIEEVLADSNS